MNGLIDRSAVAKELEHVLGRVRNEEKDSELAKKV
jgi:hypothetical protein